MMDLLRLFAANLLPIFLIAAVGAVVAATLRLDARPLSLVTFHVFSPALVFTLIVHSTLDGAEVARMAGFATVAMGVPGLLALAYARAARLTRERTAALLLVVMFANAGNFGLSLVSLAFGPAALAHAAIYFATMVALTFTAGVVVASLGRADARTALAGVLRVPTVYAVVLALLMKAAGAVLPGPVDRSVGLLADAAIPAMLVVLGMQLHRNGRLRPEPGLAPALAFRLLAGPAAAVAVAPVFGLDGPARQAGIVQSAVPTAVVTTVLADAYGLEPSFVTQAVMVSTLLSPLTLTPLLAWLGAA